MIPKLNQKFTVDSIAIVTSPKIMNITEIPFPSVTIMSSIMLDMSGAMYEGAQELSITLNFFNISVDPHLIRILS